MDAELTNLYDQLLKNLEENVQLNELFLRFFQSKTKLSFLFNEKEHKLILMKFLSFFNEFVIKINTNKPPSVSATSHQRQPSIDRYDEDLYNPLRHLENIPIPIPYQEIGYPYFFKNWFLLEIK